MHYFAGCLSKPPAHGVDDVGGGNCGPKVRHASAAKELTDEGASDALPPSIKIFEDEVCVWSNDDAIRVSNASMSISSPLNIPNLRKQGWVVCVVGFSA